MDQEQSSSSSVDLSQVPFHVSHPADLTREEVSTALQRLPMDIKLYLVRRANILARFYRSVIPVAKIRKTPSGTLTVVFA
jgi:hypothetical protein